MTDKKGLQAAKTLVEFCKSQRGCQNCIFRKHGADHWKCHIEAFDLQGVLSNIEAKRKITDGYKGVTTMPNETQINYEEEFYKLMEFNERYKMDIYNLEREIQGLKNELLDAKKETAFAEGQVEAFRFCVSKRGADNG